MNVLLAPVSGITILKDVPTVYFPVMWFENKAGVPKNLVFQLSLLAKLPTILQGMGWAEVGTLNLIQAIKNNFHASGWACHINADHCRTVLYEQVMLFRVFKFTGCPKIISFKF